MKFDLVHHVTIDIHILVAHDVSARDWQMKKNGGQWLVGKVHFKPPSYSVINCLNVTVSTFHLSQHPIP